MPGGRHDDEVGAAHVRQGDRRLQRDRHDVLRLAAVDGRRAHAKARLGRLPHQHPPQRSRAGEDLQRRHRGRRQAPSEQDHGHVDHSPCPNHLRRIGESATAGSRWPSPSVSQGDDHESRRRPTNPNQALWEKGDFTRIADSMRESGEALVAPHRESPRASRCSTSAAATGRRRCPAARLGADVLGVDIARNLVEAGNRRAQAGGPRRTAGSSRATRPTSRSSRRISFDLVVSIFGAMFAPKPFDVAKEMVRVTRPGGRIVMGNWIPNDPTLVAQILKISSAYSPPPPEGFVSPMTWGVESNVRRALRRRGRSAGDRISFARDTYTFDFPGPAGRVRRRLPELLRPDHERLRGRREERPGRRAATELEALFTARTRRRARRRPRSPRPSCA